jgi:hypothetical protein
MLEYKIEDKIEWTMIFILEFAKKYNLTLRQAFRYLSRYKGIDYIDRCYAYAHTQSFDCMVEDIAMMCRRYGGKLQW